SGFGLSRGSSTSGVLPTRSRRLRAVFGDSPSNTEGQSLLSPRHRGEKDHRFALGNWRLVALAGADVLAADVDVRVVELLTDTGKARGGVVERVGHGLAVGEHLALAACLIAQRRWDPDDAHARIGLQNST